MADANLSQSGSTQKNWASLGARTPGVGTHGPFYSGAGWRNSGTGAWALGLGTWDRGPATLVVESPGLGWPCSGLWGQGKVGNLTRGKKMGSAVRKGPGEDKSALRKREDRLGLWAGTPEEPVLGEEKLNGGGPRDVEFSRKGQARL